MSNVDTLMHDVLDPKGSELPSHSSITDYTEEVDRRMDKTVTDHLNVLACTWHPNASLLELSGVLVAVVDSDKRLDRKYLDYNRATSLLQENELLRFKVAEAWRTEWYGDLRRLDILRAPMLSRARLSESKLIALGKALTSTYQGYAVDAFHQYLKNNNTKYCRPGSQKYYGKFCSIVQSSGTGKTRLMLELCKKGVCVLYMNIRPPEDNQGYPKRDDTPADMLTNYCTTEDNYRTRCYIFFSAVFKVLRTFLEEMRPGWYEDMCKIESRARLSFFEALDREFANVHREILASSAGSTIMEKYYSQLTSSKNFPWANMDEPGVVIALDEAHVLHDNSQKGFSRADVFLQTIKEYSEVKRSAVWVVFASTTSKVAHLASPRIKTTLVPSARFVTEGQLRFPPFTQLGWDQNAPVLEAVERDEVAKAGHILQYGRPLWVSLKGSYTLEDLLTLAAKRLCGSEVFDPGNEDQAFAVLAQRFGLDIAFGHRDAVRFVETSVASHLRFCINTTEDGTRSYSTYPSEPILSCAAASLLLDDNKLDPTLQSLESMVNDGVVDINQIGELVGRFLWLLAKDFFVRSELHVINDVDLQFDQELQDCRLISVVDFLRSVFGPKMWANHSKAEKVFQNAYINFSHWVSMDSNIRRDKKGLEQLSIEQWTLCHWERTSAVQCCHNQPLIDKVIPMYFKPQNPGERRDTRVSHILLSDKARISPQKVDLKDIQRDHSSIAPDYHGLPYIAILVDLGGDEPDFDVSLDSSKDKDTCLRIYASGLDETTYPFLVGREKLMVTLRDLYKRQSAPSGCGLVQNLEDQARFGASSESRFMNSKARGLM